MATDFAVSEVVVPAAKWTLRKIWQGLGYVLCYKSNIGDLDKQVQQLCRKRDGVALEVKPATDALLIIDPGVDPWLGDVDKIIQIKEARFSEETMATKAVCCSGWLPNLKGRFSLGREAKKMTLEVDNLFAKAPVTIAHPRPHAEVEFPPTEGTTPHFHQGASSSSGTSNHEQPPPATEGGNLYFNSRRSIVEKVMEALRGKEVNPIILCGMGGIGKTTLMGQVFDKAKGEGLFDEHTKATFKESLDNAPPDLIPIQDELARFLGLSLQGRETDARASELRARLSQGNKKTLVMLDNVSKTPENFLWKIGINPSSCKILVTSRQQDLFNYMGTRKNFPVYGLPDTDAWSLFKKTAGSSIESDPELRFVAQKILEKCDGLPIAISTVGTALNGKTIGIWKNALRELGKANPENVPGVIEHVYGKINFSYECLPSQQARLCFLLCSIFEGRIAVEDLVRFGLGLFTGIDDSIADGRNCIETLVETLKSRFLLLSDDDKPGYVRMHDVVHDVALYIASETESSAGKRIVARRTAESLNLLDCPNNIISKCVSLCIDGRCKLLFVKGNSAKSELEPPPTIFNKMAEDLKVLSMEHLPLSSLGVLKNLHTLLLGDCGGEWDSEGEWDPEGDCDVSVIGRLGSLVVLDLSGRDFITQLPDTFRNLTNLRSLNLNGCGKLEVISPGVISSLTRLEELYMLESFNSCDWVVEKLASAETANWISRLEADERQVECKETRLDMWKSLHMLAVEQPDKVRHEFRIEVRRSVDGAYTDEFTRWANSMDWKTGILAELLSLSCLTTLEVVLPPVNEVLTSTTLFNKLETFKIGIGWNEDIIEYEAWDYEGNLLKLEDVDASAILGGRIGLLLENTNSVYFKSVLVSQLPNVCFAKVKYMEVEKCDAVEYLIDTTLMKPITPGSCGVFPVLDSLTIKKANRLKEVVHGELPTGSLKKLGVLELSELPALTYAWKTKTQSESALGLVEELIIEECNSLEEIVAFEDDAKEEINFESLERLRLSSLPRLAGLTRYISKQTESEQSDVIRQSLLDNKLHFPVLEYLDIEDLNIKEIWSRQVSAVSFSDLDTLYVKGCANLLHVVPTHMQIRLQKLEHLYVFSCSSLEEIFESRRLTVDDEGDAAAALTIYESANQGTQVNKMMSFAQSGQAFHNLTELIVTDCGSLKTTLLSPSIAQGLVNLESLEVNDCEKIEEIVGAAAVADGEETHDANMFPKLSWLELNNLPNLGSFSQGKYNLRWPRISDITIKGCSNMKSFCLGSLRTGREVNIDVDDENLVQELESSRQEI